MVADLVFFVSQKFSLVWIILSFWINPLHFIVIFKRDFEPRLPGKVVVYLPEFGAPSCILCILFPVHIPHGRSHEAVLAVCSNPAVCYQHPSFKLRLCKVQPISVWECFRFTDSKQTTQRVGKNDCIIFHFLFQYLNFIVYDYFQAFYKYLLASFQYRDSRRLFSLKRVNLKINEGEVKKVLGEKHFKNEVSDHICQ